MTSTSSSGVDLWWEGIELWYNHGDYACATKVWLQAVEALCHESSHRNTRTAIMDDIPTSTDETLDDYGIDRLEQEWHTMIVPAALSVDNSKETYDDDNTTTTEEEWDMAKAQFLLFVAGCCLDATDIGSARKCLVQSLRHSVPLWRHRRHHDSTTVSLSSLVADTLQEYMASYQEEAEDDVNDQAADSISVPSWIVAQRVVALTLPERQLIPRLRWTSMYQRPAYWYQQQQPKQQDSNGYCSPPVYSEQEQPIWCRQLESHFTEIQREFQQLLSRTVPTRSTPSDGGKNDSDTAKRIIPTHWPKVGDGDHRGGAGDHDGSVVGGIATDDRDGGDWREIVLVGTGAQPHLAPRTVALLHQYCSESVLSLADVGAGEVIFSLIAGQTHIRPHTASHNIRLTAHLGLQIPASNNPNNRRKECYLRVADQVCHWEVGKILVFDDSYEHEVVNETDEIRAVLLLRFWHPDIPSAEREGALQRILTAKQDDQCRRCLPPLPPQHSCVNSIQGAERGMRRTVCPSCWQTGFDTLRLVATTNGQVIPPERSFVCTCGSVVD